MAKLGPGAFAAARKAAQLTQKQAATLCGVDERTYQRWEAGHVTRLRPVYLEKLRAAAKRGA